MVKRPMKIYMETTKIPTEKTVAEIQCLLGGYGCTGVMTTFENGEVTAVCFKILFLDKEVAFKLPARWEPIKDELMSRVKKPRENTEQEIIEQAKRVAWRQILRWVQAQLALVETRMVKVFEVFLPYVQTNLSGKTLFEQIEDKGFKALEYKGSPTNTLIREAGNELDA